MGVLAMCSFAAALAQGAPQPQSAPDANRPKSARSQAAGTNPAMETAGELKFQQNCSRCHNAPQELSPRIAGAVVMHMRVRASLNEEDAKAILKYLAP